MPKCARPKSKFSQSDLANFVSSIGWICKFVGVNHARLFNSSPTGPILLFTSAVVDDTVAMVDVGSKFCGSKNVGS